MTLAALCSILGFCQDGATICQGRLWETALLTTCTMQLLQPQQSDI